MHQHGATHRRRHARRITLVFGALAALATAALTAGAAASTSATPPSNTSPPIVSGTAQQGHTLTASSGSWSGSTPIAFSYSWRRCDTGGASCSTISGATNQTYVLGSADVGHTLRVNVTAQNSGGSASALSAPTATVAAVNAPVNTSLPTVSGTAREGSTLNGSPGSWQGTAPISYAYQWQRCDSHGASCGSISSATNQSYTLTRGDVGHSLRLRVTASNAGGASQALSDATAVIASLGTAPASTGVPTVSGSALQGSTLSASTGRWSGTTPLQYTYAWLRCDQNGNHCGTISGATSSSYALTADDVAYRIRVSVTARNAAGAAVATSAPTALVQGPPVLLDLPTISGSAGVGSKLSATAGRWRSVTSLTLSFQWARCDASGQHCSPIPGATASSYTPTTSDVGHALFVQVKAQNRVGPTWANSKPTGAVAGAPTSAVAVTSVSLPDRLVVDRISFSPSRVTSRSQPLVGRFHVSEVDGHRPVAGALVYAVGVPFNHLSNEPEATTGSDGWATITFRVLRAQSLRRGSLVVVFVRARKPGDNLLAGVSTRRLVSARVG